MTKILVRRCRVPKVPTEGYHQARSLVGVGTDTVPDTPPSPTHPSWSVSFHFYGTTRKSSNRYHSDGANCGGSPSFSSSANSHGKARSQVCS